jgi:uncharacterized protein DUF4440
MLSNPSLVIDVIRTAANRRRLNGKDEVLRIHTDVFYGSLKDQNYAAIEDFYSDDYMLVRPYGAVLNKQEVLIDLRVNGLTFNSIDARKTTVRMYGSAVVVTGESGSRALKNKFF